MIMQPGLLSKSAELYIRGHSFITMQKADLLLQQKTPHTKKNTLPPKQEAKGKSK